MDIASEKSRSSESDTSQHEALLGFASPQVLRPPPRRRQWVLHVLFAVVNVALLAFTLSSIPPTHPDIYSPAAGAVKYEVKTLNLSIFSENEYNGEPNPRQHKAWEELLSHQNIMVTADELKKLNRTSVEVPGQSGRYMAELSMFHQLHCLNYLRHYIYSDYYPTHEDNRTVRLHVSHCIDALRQVIQCHGDTSIITYSWRPDYSRPWPDFQPTKQCRSYGALKAWTGPREFPYNSSGWDNPILSPDWDRTTPTSREGSTELVQGTRTNPKVMHDLGLAYP